MLPALVTVASPCSLPHGDDKRRDPDALCRDSCTERQHERAARDLPLRRRDRRRDAPLLGAPAHAEGLGLGSTRHRAMAVDPARDQPARSLARHPSGIRPAPARVEAGKKGGSAMQGFGWMKRLLVIVPLAAAVSALGFLAVSSIARGAPQVTATVSLRTTKLGAILVG